MAEKILIVVDMQKDFVNGSLGSKDAEAIVPAVVKKAKEFDGDLIPELEKIFVERDAAMYEKITFGCPELAEDLLERNKKTPIESIELVGLCTDICVVSNALLIKAFLPETPVFVDSACAAGVTRERHEAALETMRSCQIVVK